MGLTVVAVTGTNGKTSTALAVHGALVGLGVPSVCYGSLGVTFGHGPPVRTTSEWMVDPDWIAERLRSWARARGDDVVLVAEVTSRWIEMGVAERLRPHVGVLTSLGADHLDLHGGVGAYHRLKLRLLGSVRAGGHVVCPAGLAGAARGAVPEGARWTAVGEGAGLPHTVTARSLHPARTSASVRLSDGTTADLAFPTFSAPLLGNALLAAATLGALGVPERTALGAAAAVPLPPGRHEPVVVGGRLAAVVDSGHNPEAVGGCLRDVAGAFGGRVVTVLGCGGNRDRWKRRAMGAVAASLSAAVVVTDDNPRGEAPEAIRSEVLAGAPDAVEVAGREDGLAAALDLAGRDGLVVALGMGSDPWARRGGEPTTDAAELDRLARARTGGPVLAANDLAPRRAVALAAP